MRVGFDMSHMHKLSQNRGIGIYGQNLYESIKKYTNVDIKLIEEKTDYQQFDLIHFPFFDLFKHTLPIKLPFSTIVTIHDLIPIQFPKHYPPGVRGKINWQLQKLALKNVKQIITVSKTVKSDIEKKLNIARQKISVVYSAPPRNFEKLFDKKLLENTKSKYQLPEKFVLYVGNVNWNKNILNMAQACIEARSPLVIIGSAFLDKANLNHPEKKSFRTFLEKFGENKNIKIIGFIPEDELGAIMNLATCLIFVSFYEGFGFPILEAQASGLPVITSRVSSMPEVAGKGAIFVDPENVSEIAHSIERVFSSESLRKKLIGVGHENLKRFSWKKTALETVEVYQKCV